MDEKRAAERTAIATACRATFEYAGGLRSALMVDLSPQGAGFLLYQSEPFGLKQGDRLQLQVITGLGESRFVGSVKWIGFVTAGIRFGVKFEEIAADDPLLSYADSPF